MNAAIAPPVAAAVAAVALTLQRFVVPLLFELDVGLSAPANTHYTLAARFASFLLVYGVLLGVAYWAGAQDGGDGGPRHLFVAGVTFAVAAAAALVASVVVLQVLGWGTQGLFVAFAATVGQSASTGVQLGVVAFAGLAAGSR